MVKSHLHLDTINQSNSLPITLDGDSDQLERALILKQLLYLRQDINEIKQILMLKKGDMKDVAPSNSALFLPSPETKKTDINLDDNYTSIDEAYISGLKDEAIGEMTMDELEKEVIEKYLKKFKNNRRKTAEALNISERTLYRKIKEYNV